MSMRKLIVAGLVMFGSLYLGACLEDPSATTAPKDEAVLVTNAHVQHDGESTIVTGLVNGAKRTIVASEISAPDPGSFLVPVDDGGGDGGGCLLCLVNTDTGRVTCVPVKCPAGF